MTGVALGLFALGFAGGVCVFWMGRRIFRWWRWSRTRRYLREIQTEGYNEHRRRNHVA